MAVVERRIVSVASNLFMCLFSVAFIDNGKADIPQLDFGVTATNATEGGPFNYKCSGTFTIIYWQDSSGNQFPGKTLSFISISRTDVGLYTCYEKLPFQPAFVVEAININVLYPAKFLSVSKPGLLNIGDEYILHFSVEGNPSPETSFTPVANSTDISHYYISGSNVIINSVKCEDGGAYTLLASNSVATDSKTEEIRIQCAPSPSSVIIKSDVLKPRLGDNITLSVFTTNYPYDHFTWTDEGVKLNSTDMHFESELSLPNFEFNQFGNYSVSVANGLGEISHTFKLAADGPPDPITNLRFDSCTDDSVVLSWISGFNYGSPQTFVVKRIQNGKETDFKNVTDPSKYGLEKGDYVLNGLDSSTNYTFTVYSVNKNGTSTGPQGVGTVQFQTADESSEKSHTKTIVVGLIGALAGVVLLVVVGRFLRKWMSQNRINQLNQRNALYGSMP